MKNFIAIAAALLILPTSVFAQSSAVQIDWSVLGADQTAVPYAPPASQRSMTQAQAAQYQAASVTPAPMAQPSYDVSTIEPAAQDLDLSVDTAPAPDPTGLWGAKWSGRANAGLSMQSGNSDTESLNLDAKVGAKWDKYRLTAKADYAREEDQNVKTEDNRSLELLADYFFKPKWFANANLKWDQDDIAGLDLRSSYGVALGHQPFDRDDLSLKYQLGPNYLKEERTNGSSDDSLAYNWQLDYEQKFWSDNVEFFHNHQLLVPSDETSQYLLETTTGARIPLRKSIIATLEIEHDVDKGAPVGTSEADTKYGVKLGYEW